MEKNQEKIEKTIYNLNYSITKYKRLIRECNVTRFALCLIDVSNFKNYNYLYGYEFGNKLLNSIYEELRKCIGKFGYVCLNGGSVFLVILDKKPEKTDVIHMAIKVQQSFKNEFTIEGIVTKVQINIGIALYPEHDNNIEAVMRCAEIALDYSKKLNPYKYCIFNKEMHKLAVNTAAMELNLLKSSYDKDFSIYYHPEYDVEKMKIVGAEAEIRWKNNNDFNLAKDLLFMASQKGMEQDINMHVINKVCKQMKLLNQKGKKNIKIYMNMSSKILMKEGFIEGIDETLTKHKIDSDKFVVEIPSKMLNRADGAAVKAINSLKRRGIKVFLDDFGERYSSISSLMNLPVDGIKLSKSIISNMERNGKNIVVFQNIMRMSRELNMETIAVGVESKRQVEFLRKMGCKRVQGPAVSKPLDEKSFLRALE